jgi:UDP-N-acetylmuramate: L-alanyl-gamma-D-glutamyl-meso-diaminopimelate ligase
MTYHLIAIGGAVMHNLALALKQNGHIVTGSDDEIYEPARSRLKAMNLLPDTEGWHPERISSDVDAVILGMHARKDNSELARAQELGLPIYSFPEFIYNHSAQKTRVVVAGSHGKTTTTSMIMHVLRHAGRDFDYLVGALLEGFDTMVRLSDAPVMIIEGDEYLSSPIDLRPKIMHYKPHVAIITGVAWDHANVFPTFENYVLQFENFIKTLDTEGSLFWYKHDKELQQISAVSPCKSVAYDAFESSIARGKTVLKTEDGRRVNLEVFGDHNLANLKAAYLACKEIGVSDDEFFAAIPTFTGAAKRLQILAKAKTSIAFLDFAHAPSKAKATIDAMKAQYPKRQLVACLELHTFSSLNKAFLPQYRDTMNAADEAVVFFNEHTLAMKKMPPLSTDEVKTFFNHPNLTVFTDNQQLVAYLKEHRFKSRNLLLMTSGTFVGLNLKELATELLK